MSVKKFFLNLPIARKLLFVSAVPILAVLILSVVTYKSVQTFSLDEDRLNDVYHVQQASAEFMRLVVDLETGFRGFVLTKGPQFLQPYQAAKHRVLQLGNSLKHLVKDVEPQRKLMESVQERVIKLMADKDQLIERVKEGHTEEALDYIEAEKGRLLMLAIREEMAQFDQQEVGLLRQALESSSADRSVLMAVVVGGGGVALILMLLPLHLIARSITGPLTSLVKTVEKVSGKSIPDVPVLDRRDEIGDLTRVMGIMGTQLRAYIRHIEQSENELRLVNHDLSISEAKYRGIVDHAPIGIFAAEKGRLMFSSRQNWVIVGMDPDSRPDPEQMWDAIHPDEQQDVRTAFQGAWAKGQSFERVFRFLHSDGAVRKVLSRAVPLKDETGSTVAYQGFNVDITAMEQMRTQLNRAERLATLGQVAAGIAHEIRNPLVGIGSTATLLLEDFEPSDSRHEDLQIILKETRRLDRIVNQIVDFARPRDLLPLTFSLADLIQESLHVLGGPLKEKAVCVSFDPPVQLPSIRADRDQLKQVILNIIQNAIEAVALQGHLGLFLAEELYEQELGVRLRVVDNGKGISPSALPRIFEPFFTIGKIRGTGLGLAICRNIIESHGGEIHAESQEGHGTTISIWLPCQLQPQPLTV